MSKIYEALRQAELDRAKNSPAPSDPETLTPTAQAVLDNPHAPVSSISAALLATARPFPRTLADMTADQTPAAPGDARAGGLTGMGGLTGDADGLALDLSNVPEYTWNPSLHQLPALEQRGSAVEQFRSLRSRMQEFRDLNTLKSILVSSGLPQEGKSFVAANLAISFARHKAGRVLLIDGDMRRSTQHKMLGCPEGPGLTEYLAGNATLVEIMQRPKPSEAGHPLPPGLASLIFIPGGHASERAADLSGNRRFDRLIAAVTPHFDWVVVDSSPVNLVSDGVNLARACDGVLLIARASVTKFEVAQRALAELKASKVLGFVLNAVENPPIAGGYYGYDGYDKVKEQPKAP